MLLCRVVVGAYCIGKNDQLVPDCRDPDGILYDSCVDDLARPQIFVAFHDAQAYPEYQVSFKVK